MITGELKSKIDRVWDASQQLVLLDEVASDGWWVDVTLPMLELARLRIRGLVRFVEPTFGLIVDELTANGIVDRVGSSSPRTPIGHPPAWTRSSLERTSTSSSRFSTRSRTAHVPRTWRSAASGPARGKRVADCR